jgi:PAS domain S-box-containing protein
LNEKLDEFVTKQLEISREIRLPILDRLSYLSEEQLLQISKMGMIEYLGYLSENRAKQQIEDSLKKWVADQLEVIGKFELVAEDITLINYVRNRSFHYFLPAYTSDITQCLKIIEELDSFFTTSITAATDTYIMILKEQVSEREEKLLEAQEIAHIGNFEWDIQKDVSKSSPEIQKIFGLEGENRFQSFMNNVHIDDVQLVKNNLSNAFQNGHFESEYRYVKDGITKYIWTKGIVSYEDGKPSKMMGTIQDLTQRKKAERELMEKTIALERSNESLQQFAYVASHDLKEPIRKIATFTDMVLISEQNLTSSSRANLTKVFTSAVRMRQMIDDIMAYSTLTQWEDKVVYPIDKLIQEATEILEQAIADKKANITYQNLPSACIVPSQMRQLFQNLLANALKFSKPDVTPQISISSKWVNKDELPANDLLASDKYLQIQVADNGIGFEQDAAEKIFGLFSRLHSKAQYEGSGLGLAIVKRIVDNHGGLVQAQGKKGEGSTFIVILPQ